MRFQVNASLIPSGIQKIMRFNSANETLSRANADSISTPIVL